MCENPSLGTPSIFHLHLKLALYLALLSRCFFFFFISEPLYLSLLLSAVLILGGRGPFFPPISSSSRLFSCPSAAAAAASWCCSHFSSPEAHSWVRGNVWLYLYGASFLLDSYCFGTEVPHSKFIKGQFNSKFMKWASVKVPAPMCFVCSHGASATPVPFPSLIRNYWVDSFLFNTKNLTVSFPCTPTTGTSDNLTQQHLSNLKSSEVMVVTVNLTWSFLVIRSPLSQ